MKSLSAAAAVLFCILGAPLGAREVKLSLDTTFEMKTAFDAETLKAFKEQRADLHWRQPVPDDGDFSQAKVNLGCYFANPDTISLDEDTAPRKVDVSSKTAVGLLLLYSKNAGKGELKLSLEGLASCIILNVGYEFKLTEVDTGRVWRLEYSETLEDKQKLSGTYTITAEKKGDEVHLVLKNATPK